jgi:hypothetical protein
MGAERLVTSSLQMQTEYNDANISQKLNLAGQRVWYWKNNQNISETEDERYLRWGHTSTWFNSRVMDCLAGTVGIQLLSKAVVDCGVQFYGLGHDLPGKIDSGRLAGEVLLPYGLLQISSQRNITATLVFWRFQCEAMNLNIYYQSANSHCTYSRINYRTINGLENSSIGRFDAIDIRSELTRAGQMVYIPFIPA